MNLIIGDDRLLRGELSTIIKLMKNQLRAKKLRPHVVAPVSEPVCSRDVMHFELIGGIRSCRSCYSLQWVPGMFASWSHILMATS